MDSRDPKAPPDKDEDADPKQLAARCRELELLLHSILDNVPLVLWRIDREGDFTLHEGRGLASAGLTKGQFLGKNLFELYGEDVDVRRALAGEFVHNQANAHGVSWESWIVALRDAQGAVDGAIGVTLDSSEARRTEMELRAQLELVERQRQVIQQMGTPILQVWEGVLALPMIGVIDSTRTAEVMDSLLDAVVRERARFALLDLTGVEAVDTKAAAYLIELVRAIRLLGAEGIITGIRPSVAQTIVAIGVDLGEITTLSNLRAGLRHCIVRMRQEARPASGEGPR